MIISIREVAPRLKLSVGRFGDGGKVVAEINPSSRNCFPGDVVVAKDGSFYAVPAPGMAVYLGSAHCVGKIEKAFSEAKNGEDVLRFFAQEIAAARAAVVRKWVYAYYLTEALEKFYSGSAEELWNCFSDEIREVVEFTANALGVPDPKPHTCDGFIAIAVLFGEPKQFPGCGPARIPSVLEPLAVFTPPAPRFKTVQEAISLLN